MKDTAGNARPAGTIGTFAANIAFAWQLGGVLTVEYDNSGTPLALGTSGSSITATKGSTTLTFPGVTSIVVSGTSSADTLNFNGPMTLPIALNLGSGADVLNVNSGARRWLGCVGGHIESDDQRQAHRSLSMQRSIWPPST